MRKDRDKTVREHVAEEVLQLDKEIRIGDRTYSVPPPSTATLVMVSGLIPSIPAGAGDEKNVLGWVMTHARDYGIIGDILAVMVLGARKCKAEERKYTGWRGKWQRKRMTEREELARYILEETTPAEQFTLLTAMVGRMQVADFFGLTTFLNGLNIIPETRVGEMTVSGR